MSSPRPRPYRKRKRAESEAATRQRITEAAVELHGTVGPAKTTMTEIGKRAGVSRMTVYNHFPTETDLFVACSTHWANQNPFPDPSLWTDIADPSERLVVGLMELYGWYREKEGMLGNVLRDMTAIPSLTAVMNDLWWPYMEEVVRVLTEPWSLTDTDPEMLHALLLVAVDFNTWRVLTRSALDVGRASEVAGHMVRGAVSGAQVDGQCHDLGRYDVNFRAE